jgi:tetratricopeptide (TPR) repeat protein
MRRAFFPPYRLSSRTLPVRLTNLLLFAVLTVLLLGFSSISIHAAEVSEPDVIQKSAPEPSRSELFLSAQAAYDGGRYADAAKLYGVLVSNGVDNVEVHYNLANAYFREGDLPSAVLNYRKAWYLAPRDPDIRANLHFALNAAGAIESTPTLQERVFTSLSKGEWIIAATISYTVLILILILILVLRLSRRLAVKMILLPILLILLSTGGWLRWRQLVSNPEWVVMDSNAIALFGPIDGTTAHYKVPLGALVKQRGTDTKGWVEIEYDGKIGWLKVMHIKRI